MILLAAAWVFAALNLAFNPEAREPVGFLISVAVLILAPIFGIAAARNRP